MRTQPQKHLFEGRSRLSIRLERIYVHLRALWRSFIGSCWACGTPSWSKGVKHKKIFVKGGMICNYCNKRIKIK